MKIVVTYVFVFVLFLVGLCLPTFAQTFTVTGPSSVCPNTDVTYTLNGPVTSLCSVTWTANSPAVFVPRSTTFNTVTGYFAGGSASGLKTQLTANVTCSGGNNTPSIAVTVNAAGRNDIFSTAIPCTASGNQTFSIPMVGISGSPVWTNNAGWPEFSRSSTDGGTTQVVYVVPVSGDNATVHVQVNNALCNNALNQATFNVTRTADRTAPVWTSHPAQLCFNTSGTFSVAAYPGATGYVWNSSIAGVLINNQTPPVTLGADGNSVLVTAPAGAASTTISVTAQSICGQSDAATSAVTVGTPHYTLTGPTRVGAGLNVSYTILPDATGTNYEWETGGAQIISGGGHKIVAQWPESAGGQPTTMGCLLTGPATCGQPILVSLDVQLLGGLFLISPNPAASTINISQETAPTLGNAKMGQAPVLPSSIDEVQVIDKFNNIKKTRKFPAGTYNTSIDISDLPADMYILHIRSGNNWTSKKVMVNAH